MSLAHELQAIEPSVRPSPLPGFEHVGGYGVFGSPFDSGHVLALRVFPQNDFVPYKTVWHRTPDGVWSIFVDAPRHDVACPRYYGAAATHVQTARITVTWMRSMDLRIEIDVPRLIWSISLQRTPLLRIMNLLSPRLPDRLWRSSVFLRLMERTGQALLGMGRVTLTGVVPNGQLAMLMPRQMFFLASAAAELNGEDLGQPARVAENPSIGGFRLPARPLFAVGRGYFEILDPVEHERTVWELREERLRMHDAWRVQPETEPRAR
jgi:hypothetical protein